jgi:hypothetical protein
LQHQSPKRVPSASWWRGHLLAPRGRVSQTGDGPSTTASKPEPCLVIPHPGPEG